MSPQSDVMPAAWSRIAPNKLSPYGSINWATSLGQMDPYLVWSDAVSERLQKSDESAGLASWVSVLVELGHANQFVTLAMMLEDILPSHAFPVGKHRFLTLLVKPDRVSKLVTAAQKKGSPVVRFELGQARALSSGALTDTRFWFDLFNLKVDNVLQPKSTSESSGSSARIPTRVIGLAKAQVARPREYVQKQQVRQQRSEPMIAIVDDRCNFASLLLRGSGADPIVSGLWHQSDDPRIYERLGKFDGWRDAFRIEFDGQGRPSDISGSFCGRHLLLDAQDDLNAMGEEAVAYRRSQYLPASPRWSHGSAVAAAIAGGATLRHRDKARPLVPQTLAFTQLPIDTVHDTSGGSLGCAVLDALNDAVDLSERAGRPLIANISYGTYSGPHDGTSIFESALRELLEKHSQVQVVLPAGNSHLSRTHSAGWLEPGRTATLRWKVMPDNAADSFCELWLDRPEHAVIDLMPPGEHARASVQAGHAFVWPDASAPSAAVIFPLRAAQGLNGSMALLAVSGTRRSFDRPTNEDLAKVGATGRRSQPAKPGVWQIQIRNKHATERLSFDAWIQRGDNPPGRTSAAAGHLGRQGTFLDAFTPEDLTQTDPRSTLNGIATTSCPGRLWVVGASRAQDGSTSLYSSAGPNRNETSRCEGPDLLAPADTSLMLPGILTAGMLGAARVRVGGTSIAAGVFTRRLYQHLAENPAHTPLTFAAEMRGNLQTRERPLQRCGAAERAESYLRRGQFEQIAPEDGDHGSQGPRWTG